MSFSVCTKHFLRNWIRKCSRSSCSNSPIGYPRACITSLTRLSATVTAARGSSTNRLWTWFQRTAKLDRSAADSGRILNFSLRFSRNFSTPSALRGSPSCFLLYNPIVFGPKALPQFLAAALAHGEKQDSSHGDYGDDDNYNQELSLIHAPWRSTMCCCGMPVPAGMLSKRIFAIVARKLSTSTRLTPSGHYAKPIPA